MTENIRFEEIGIIAGDIEALLEENQGAINDAYETIGKGMKVSIGVALCPAPGGIETEITVTFPREQAVPVEKCKATRKRVISNQVAMDLGTNVYKLGGKNE